MSIEDEIEETEKKLRETPVNKSTETDRARLKSKIARLREKKEKQEKKSSGSGKGYAVRKRGDRTVALVGPPSVGKSTLLNKLTNADSEVGHYEFTTLDVIPGMMRYRGAYIQILDVPGLIGGAASGKGRGKEVLSVIRNSDMIVVMIDPDNLDRLEKIKDEIHDAGIRLNEDKPRIKIERRPKGGIDLTLPRDFSLNEETVKSVLRENGYLNCRLILKEDLSVDEIIDGIMDNRVYIPALTVFNKIEKLGDGELEKVRNRHPDFVPVSAEETRNLEKLKERIWEKLNVMRIYMKKIGKEPDKEEPFIVEKESTIEEVKEKLPGEFKGELDYGKIWGPSARFPGQKVGGDHVLKDEDVLELHF
ncbi:MAG: OBG GTPase family GTP-binding protein [Candidatus Aenigmatarchaeota archaeon]